MPHDLVIRGGTVLDGTGADRFTADIAISDGMIAAIEAKPGAIGPGERELDAKGALVTPGFVDIHTHYDGQASWDTDLAPSTLHGVTTAVMGSCGVGFAPVRTSDHERLVQLMEGVEDIPGTALHEGLTWNWESFPEYLDALDAFGHAADIACQIPHDALRVYVMGERAVAHSIATEDDIQRMHDLVAEALEAGAVGFSTGRTDNHRSAQGKFTPASEAGEQELVGIAKAFAGRTGVLQAVSDFDFAQGSAEFDREFDILQAMVEAGSGHKASFSLLQRDNVPGQYKRILKRVSAAREQGLDLRVQVACRPIGVLLGLEATFNPFMGFPSYKKIHAEPLAERVRIMSDPAFKAQLLTEESEPVAGDGSAIPALADELLNAMQLISMRIFRLGRTPDYEPAMENSLFFEAQRTGEPVMSVLYDAMLEDDGEALLYFPLYNYAANDLKAVREMMTHPAALPGLSDGGAHVGTICDASFPTTLLTHWGRDRSEGTLPLERLVQMQTADTADHMGFTDRGRLQVGKKADLNLIDFDRLTLKRPGLARDLPAGGRRLVQEAEGYIATVLSGQIVRENGAFTDAKPGRVVRT